VGIRLHWSHCGSHTATLKCGALAVLSLHFLLWKMRVTACSSVSGRVRRCDIHTASCQHRFRDPLSFMTAGHFYLRGRTIAFIQGAVGVQPVVLSSWHLAHGVPQQDTWVSFLRPLSQITLNSVA
jgi:hypothetical protein